MITEIGGTDKTNQPARKWKTPSAKTGIQSLLEGVDPFLLRFRKPSDSLRLQEAAELLFLCFNRLLVSFTTMTNRSTMPHMKSLKKLPTCSALSPLDRN